MVNYYDINVSLKGRHFFATAERSCRDWEKAQELVIDFAKRFPAAEGFEVSCTFWEGSGTVIDTKLAVNNHLRPFRNPV